MRNEIEQMANRNGVFGLDPRELFLIFLVGLVGVGHIERQLPDLWVEMKDAGGLVRFRRLEEGGPGPGLPLKPRPGKARLFAGEEIGRGEELGQVHREPD